MVPYCQYDVPRWMHLRLHPNPNWQVPHDEPHVKARYAGQADHHITFLHPGYDNKSRQSVLLGLQASDRDGSELYFGTALAVSRIVAGNSKTGFLASQRGGRKIDLQHDELLRSRKYYLYNSDVDNAVYPVYRSFRDWSFPHGGLPAEWSAMAAVDTDNDNVPPSVSGMAAYVSAPDKTCRVSGKRGADSFESAHLVPRTEGVGFRRMR